ncbi:MAG: LON peptidase substrate-binding domain-containing protein [Bdellovibrionales bacterium]
MNTLLSASAVAPSALPDTLLLLPLSGVILLPEARLPLAVTEDRHKDLIDEVLGQPGRLVGLVQPMIGDNDQVREQAPPPLYKVGCAGKVVSFNEEDDGRYVFSLVGICRFLIGEELPPQGPCRIARPIWKNYLSDLGQLPSGAIMEPDERDHLLDVLRDYFKRHGGMEADWNTIQEASDDSLITSLAMICPLATSEKQALLEAPDMVERAKLLTALLTMASHPATQDAELRH